MRKVLFQKQFTKRMSLKILISILTIGIQLPAKAATIQGSFSWMGSDEYLNPPGGPCADVLISGTSNFTIQKNEKKPNESTGTVTFALTDANGCSAGIPKPVPPNSITMESKLTLKNPDFEKETWKLLSFDFTGMTSGRVQK